MRKAQLHKARRPASVMPRAERHGGPAVNSATNQGIRGLRLMLYPEHMSKCPWRFCGHEVFSGTNGAYRIEGVPPDLLQELTLCPFAPRCDYAFDRCWEELPQSVEVNPQHLAACFYDVEKGGPRDGI